MKIELISSKTAARTELVFESGPYDAIPPVGAFFMDGRLRRVDPDRLAIACVLMLKPYLSGPLALPAPCSPEVAHGLETFLAPLDVRIQTIEHSPFAKPIGARTALLLPPADQAADLGDARRAQPHDLTFRLSGAQRHQTLMAFDAVELCCNLRALAADHPAAMGEGLLGLAILCAEDMAVGRLRCPAALVDGVENFDALARTAAALQRAYQCVAAALRASPSEGPDMTRDFCPICNGGSFGDFGGVRRAQCVDCKSLERHRMLALYLLSRPIGREATLCMVKQGKGAPPFFKALADYLTVSVLDVEDLENDPDRADGGYDIVYHSHILNGTFSESEDYIDVVGRLDALVKPGGAQVFSPGPMSGLARMQAAIFDARGDMDYYADVLARDAAAPYRFSPAAAFGSGVHSQCNLRTDPRQAMNGNDLIVMRKAR